MNGKDKKVEERLLEKDPKNLGRFRSPHSWHWLLHRDRFIPTTVESALRELESWCVDEVAAGAGHESSPENSVHDFLLSLSSSLLLASFSL